MSVAVTENSHQVSLSAIKGCLLLVRVKEYPALRIFCFKFVLLNLPGCSIMLKLR